MTYQILVLPCRVLCADLHSLPCGPISQRNGEGHGRLGATLCFSLSQGTYSPPERLLSSRELMQEKRWSQPPSAVQIPCSKGLSVLTLDDVQSLGCWCHVRFTLHCLSPLWNSWGTANSFVAPTAPTFLCRQFSTTAEPWLNVLCAIRFLPYPLFWRWFPGDSHHRAECFN